MEITGGRKPENTFAQEDCATLQESYRLALQVVDEVVLKNYIAELKSMEVVPLPASLKKHNLQDNVRLFKVTEMVYEKDEFSAYKFAGVFQALSLANSTLFVMLDSNGSKTDFYMGVRSTDERRTVSSLKNTLENGLKGQFPGMKTDDHFLCEDVEELLQRVQARSISSVSCVADSKGGGTDRDAHFVQGLEKLVVAMQGKPYVGIIMANSMSHHQLCQLRQGYESIYTQLSAFASRQLTYGSCRGENSGQSETRGRSTSQTRGSSWSHTDSRSHTTGHTESHGESRGNMAGRLCQGVGAAALTVGAVLAPLTGGVSYYVGGALAGGTGLLGGLASRQHTDSWGDSSSEGESHASMCGGNEGRTVTDSEGTTRTTGQTSGRSAGLSLTLHDKAVENILARIDRQLKRLDEGESLGMFECAAYFLSQERCVSEEAAAVYRSLMSGTHTGVEMSAVTTWGDEDGERTREVVSYVRNFMHPVFLYSGVMGRLEVTPCALVSGHELAYHLGLPRHSVRGLPVVEHADFAQEVVSTGRRGGEPGLVLGSLVNMGVSSLEKVALDVNSLSMHTFVTGSTGSGKSNAVYEMLRQLDNQGIGWLVIEPAKGEYRKVFGGCPGVSVFGTNPFQAELLRVNPFRFPHGIHVLEHCDRLVELFSLCWPMYAAMPAVLKEAILAAYESSGWNLAESTNRYADELFPSFADVLDCLSEVIRQSAYSEEVKGNYMGSLVTRVRSLTNGLNGQIFASDEVDNTRLFDGKCLVDLSRLGAVETKSLLMGILVMRLSEHRFSCGEGMNVPLHHVTVLEEAHHLLRKASVGVTGEGSQVAGKSVEMMADAIAEMRTSGEGFVIVDQSPGALDPAALRNTNTKIIMRLPDEEDRRLAGHSAGLKREQLDEIAKLPCGVAVVYQNDWLEPVLCQVCQFKGRAVPYVKPANPPGASAGSQQADVLRNLLLKSGGEHLDLSLAHLNRILLELPLSTRGKIQGIKALRKNGLCTLEEIAPVVFDLVSTPELEREADQAVSLEDWTNVYACGSPCELSQFDEVQRNRILECVLREQIASHGRNPDCLDIWQQFVNQEVM